MENSLTDGEERHGSINLEKNSKFQLKSKGKGKPVCLVFTQEKKPSSVEL